MDVFNQRLSNEFNMNVVVTTPSVPYRIEYSDGAVIEISSVAQWPNLERSRGFRVLEPMVQITLLTPFEVHHSKVTFITVLPSAVLRSHDRGTQTEAIQ